MYRREAITIGATLLAILLLSACDTLTVQSSIQVRVENNATVTFDRVSYWAGNTEISYDDLGAGAATPFVDANGAYGYTTTHVVVGPDTVGLQVIDFVGETPLTPGRYTYVLTLSGEVGSRSLSQELRRDP